MFYLQIIEPFKRKDIIYDLNQLLKKKIIMSDEIESEKIKEDSEEIEDESGKTDNENKKTTNAPSSDTLFVKAKVREYIKGKSCNTSGDVIDGDALNNVIINVLDKAIGRAKANGRKTVQVKDL